MAYRYYPLERMKRLSEAVFLSYGYSAEESAFLRPTERELSPMA